MPVHGVSGFHGKPLTPVVRQSDILRLGRKGRHEVVSAFLIEHRHSITTSMPAVATKDGGRDGSDRTGNSDLAIMLVRIGVPGGGCHEKLVVSGGAALRVTYKSLRTIPKKYDSARERLVSTATNELLSRDTTNSANTGTMQLVSFRLAQEEYGIEITRVREIILMGAITRVPQTPAYIKGLINLRSMVIPVIDLRIRFGLPEGEITEESRIMVVNLGGKTVGIVVDAVSEVLRVSTDQIAPPPPTVVGLDTEYLTGLVKLEKQLLILLDIDKILGSCGAEELDALTAGGR
jgi:purine-binding chemotaxis protein CheW